MRALVPRLPILLTILLISCLPLLGQETSGELSGVAKDASGGAMPNVKVTISNQETGRIFSTKTRANGEYRAPDLAPGRYSVKFEISGFTSVAIAEVNLLLGAKLKVDGTLQVSPIAQTVQVLEKVPLLDRSSTAVSHDVTVGEFDRLPKARSFQGLLLSSPSVISGVDAYGNVIGLEGGFQVNGASAAENQFLIDGVPTDSQIHGQSRQNAQFEFLQEVQVKTGGIGAEYGGALGGVMSAVTKSGGNSFHGDLHFYWGGNDISAGPVQRLLNPLVVTVNGFNSMGKNGYVQDSKQGDNRLELGGSLGGYFIKDKLWFFAYASPQWRRRNQSFSLTNGTDGIDQKQLNQNLFGKLSYNPVSRIRTNLTWLYTPSASSGRPPTYNGLPDTTLISLQSFAINKQVGFFAPQTSYAGSVDFTLNPKMLLSVRAGRFWDNYKDTGIPGVSSVQYQTPTSDLPPNLLANVPSNLLGGQGFNNTPRLQAVAHDLVTRTFIQADYDVEAKFWGDHDIKLGVGTQKNVNNVDNTYPGGGFAIVFWNRAFQSQVPGTPCATPNPPCRGTYGYYEVDDFGVRGSTGANITNIYGQDKWTFRRVTLSLGLRAENERVPSFRRNIKDTVFQFGFGDKLAPRLGIAYDALGNGNLKLSASWGRFYDWIKYQMVRSTFGANIWTVRYRSLDTTDVFSLSGTNTPGQDLWNPAVPGSYQDNRVPSFNSVDPNLKPMGTDLVNLTAEYQWGPHTVLRAGYVHNNLRRTIEDMGVLVNGNIVFKYVNPGEGIAKFMVPSGATAEPIPTPKPERTYDAMELSFSRRYSERWFLSGSYVYSRLFGNYAGLSNTDEVRTPTTGNAWSIAQQQVGNLVRGGDSATRAWDLDQIVFDSHGNLNVKGRLPTDRPHALKLYGSYLFKYGTEVGSFFYVESGTPITTYVYTVNGIPAMVNGRGDIGRTPPLTQTDLVVAHEVKISESKKLRFEFNMINLFNEKTARHLFNCLNYDCVTGLASSSINLSKVDLFKGYDYNALILASPDGQKAFDPRYRKQDLFNPGFQGRFGIKFTF